MKHPSGPPNTIEPESIAPLIMILAGAALTVLATGIGVWLWLRIIAFVAACQIGQT